jgi:Zn-dependent M28 family amino/carboxypeptidase
VPLGAKASLSFDNTVTHSTSHNVIGVIPGTSRANEYVLYSGHWDHLGHCKPDATGDDICNGAIDNASGVGALVALADMNRRAGPAPRTQVFAAWTLEESGLLGSEFYAQHPVYPLARTVGGVNMDALSLIGPTRDVQVTGGDKSDLTAILRRVEAQMHLTETPKTIPSAATITAPTTSAWPSAACRCSPWAGAPIWSMAAPRPVKRPPKTMSSTTTTSPRTNIPIAGT